MHDFINLRYNCPRCVPSVSTICFCVFFSKHTSHSEQNTSLKVLHKTIVDVVGKFSVLKNFSNRYY